MPYKSLAVFRYVLNSIPAHQWNLNLQEGASRRIKLTSFQTPSRSQDWIKLTEIGIKMLFSPFFYQKGLLVKKVHINKKRVIEHQPEVKHQLSKLAHRGFHSACNKLMTIRGFLSSCRRIRYKNIHVKSVAAGITIFLRDYITAHVFRI